MIRRLVTSLVAVLGGLASLSAHCIEIVHYDNTPVTVHLFVGQERSIQFSDHIQIGLTKGQKAAGLFRIQSAQGGVHLLALKPFDRNRIQLKRVTDGRVIMLDLTAEKPSGGEINSENIKFLMPEENIIREELTNIESDTTSKIITPVDLARHAAQRLYGSTRLHKLSPGISKVGINDESYVKVFKGENKFKVSAKPMIGYKSPIHHLTAFVLKNTSDEIVELSYLDINIPFTHAVLQHHKLSPAGSVGDTTVFYHISDRPLKETIYPWDYHQDIKAKIARLKAEQAEQLEEDEDEI